LKEVEEERKRVDKKLRLMLVGLGIEYE